MSDDERVKRNVDDVNYAAIDGDKPMRQALRERHEASMRIPKELREKAFRERAWIQAQAASCLCAWPLMKSETESEHAIFCPAHHSWLSLQAVRSRYPEGIK